MKLLVKPHGFFFDRIKVMAAEEKGRIRALSKIGAFIMRRARSLIRPGGKRGKVSLPGESPRSHTGLLRNHIFFVYDPTTRSVVIGPEKLNTDGSAPGTLEFGGRVKVIETETPDWWEINKGVRVWRQLGKRARGKLNLPSRIRIVNIAPRPYMAPALASESANQKLLKAWENVI